MKIIITTPLYPPEIDSLANYAKDLAQKLAVKHQVTVLAYAGKTKSAEGFNLEVVDKNKPLISRLWKYTLRLSSLTKKTDIIFSQNAVAAGLPSAIVKKWRRFSLVINFSEDEAWKRALALGITDKALLEFLQSPSVNSKTKQLIKIQRWSLKQADQIIVPSKELAEVVSKYYGVNQERVVIIPLPDKLKEKLPFKAELVNEQLYINTQLYPWANLDNLFSALSLLTKDFSEIKLYLAGDGTYQKSLIKLTQELGITDRIIFLGKVSSAQDQYLQESSAMYLKNISKLSVQGLAEEIKLALANKIKPTTQHTWEEYLQRLNNVFSVLIK